jgi:hypothetical protein
MDVWLRTWRGLGRAALLLAFAGSLGACTNFIEPAGAGNDPDLLPGSPCSCGEPFYVNGVFVG